MNSEMTRVYAEAQVAKFKSPFQILFHQCKREVEKLGFDTNEWHNRIVVLYANGTLTFRKCHEKIVAEMQE